MEGPALGRRPEAVAFLPQTANYTTGAAPPALNGRLRGASIGAGHKAVNFMPLTLACDSRLRIRNRLAHDLKERNTVWGGFLFG